MILLRYEWTVSIVAIRSFINQSVVIYILVLRRILYDGGTRENSSEEHIKMHEHAYVYRLVERHYYHSIQLIHSMYMRELHNC